MHRAIAPIVGGTTVLLAAASGAAAGFREQTAWQFRGPAELQVLLNQETLRNQLDGRDVSDGGGTAIGLGAAPAVAGTTLGNSTSGSASYTVNLNGSGNSVTVDGYLNLDTNQHSEDQSSSVAQEKEAGQ
jgi:hypothetical protein